MPVWDFFSADNDDELQLDDEQRALLVELLNQDTLDPHLFRGAGQQQPIRERNANNDGPAGRLGSKLADALICAVLPILLTRILSKLLSAATFSGDILEDIVLFLQMDIHELQYNDKTLVNKFGMALFHEFARYLDVVRFQTQFKWITIAVYLAYSAAAASYMVFTAMFFFLCLALTCSRRWGELKKLLIAVVRGDNGGVF